MKSNLYSLLFLLIPVIAFAQSSKDKTIYLDSLFYETKEKDYKYYMIVKDYKKEQDEYFITRYYLSGKMESKGISKKRDLFSKKGEILSYYENENMKSTIFFEDGAPSGKCEFWYDNGIKKLQGEYIVISVEDKTKTISLKVINSWDKNNVQTVINGDGDYEDDDRFEDADSYLNAISNGKVKNGFKEGIWIGSNSRRHFTFSENYENGKLISGESIDSNNESHPYTVIRKMAEPPYGMDNFRRYTMLNYQIPENLLESGGKIITTFFIDENGKLINPIVVRGINNSSDKEAIRVLSKYVDWTLGESRGMKVKDKFTLPLVIYPAR